MTERERLIKLIEQCSCHYSPPCTGECGECHNVEMYDWNIEHIADHLLANGVIVPPCKVGDYVRFKGLTSLWRVDAIHYYREGLPQISVTNGKITTTVTDDGMFEVLTREEAERALEGMQ